MSKPEAESRGREMKSFHLEPEHVQSLYAVLEAAGLGGLRISSLHLTQEALRTPDSQSCHAELQADGNVKIVCT